LSNIYGDIVPSEFLSMIKSLRLRSDRQTFKCFLLGGNTAFNVGSNFGLVYC